MRFTKRVGDRGTVTLPSDVRRALDVDEGDIIEFDIVAIVRRRKGGKGTPLRVADLMEPVGEDEKDSTEADEPVEARPPGPADTSGA